jgi:hypothetical protein
MGDRAALVEQLDQAREGMRASLEAASAGTEVYGDWTVKDMVAHLTAWELVSTASLRAHAAGGDGGTPAAQGIDAHNAEAVASRRALAYERVIGEWEEARLELKAAIEEMPEDRLRESMLFPWGPRGTVAQIVGILAHHEGEHGEEIEQLLAT